MNLSLLGLLFFIPSEKVLPSLSVEFLDSNGKKISIEDGIVSVKSYEKIHLKVLLTVNSVEDQFEALSIEAQNQMKGSPFGQPSPNLSLSVVDTLKTTKTLPCRITCSGSGKSLTVYYLSLDIELLEEKSLREKKVGEFVEWSAQESLLIERTKKMSEEEKKSYFAAIRKHFDSFYLYNPPGLYELSARYQPATPDHWKGILQSAPVRFRVEEAGSSLDAMKQAELNRKNAPTSYAYYRRMDIDPKSLRVMLADPISGSAEPSFPYFHKFVKHDGQYCLDHFSGERRIRYNAFNVSADDSLLSRTKYQELFSGPFGKIYAESTYGYSKEREPHARFFVSSYANSIESEPAEIVKALVKPESLNLDAISVIRVFRAAPEYLVICASYGADGTLNTLAVNGAKNGDWVHSNEVKAQHGSEDVGIMFQGYEKSRARFGLPKQFPVQSYLQNGGDVLERIDMQQEMDIIQLHYNCNSQVRQDIVLKNAEQQTRRFLKFVVTEQDRVLDQLK